MKILEQYICRIATNAFLMTLVALTGVIWITQALRELDLVTGKGQTLLIFLRVTALSLPSLIMLIAPFALFIAIIYTLNKLNSDSELIVMNAAGVSPMRVLRPLLILTSLVALLVAFISLYAMPASFRQLRDLVTKIRSDVVTSVVQEGRFITLEKGITFHYREKGPGGTLLGLLVQDRRDAKSTTTYIAERGLVTEVEGSPYLVLEKGSLQRQDDKQADSAIVAFERYAIDMDQFGADGGKITYKPRERTTWELLTLDKRAPEIANFYGRYRSELHDRFANPLFPFAILAIAFVALGSARNTRQGRGQAIALAVLAVVIMRIASFSASTLSVRSAGAVALVYAVPLLVILAATLHGYVEFSARRMKPELAGASA
ncbi:MAG: LPS export ABC transporter permease LptF [Beijerinckiaceae bacterium]|nr:LPS export ABC transporter permease LptF [Beijerinckiaceae bacterium]